MTTLLSVSYYIWMDDQGEIIKSVPALEYWPSFTGEFSDGTWCEKGVFVEDNRLYAWIPNPENSEPTHEELEDGRLVKIRRWNSSVSYNRKRRVIDVITI